MLTPTTRNCTCHLVLTLASARRPQFLPSKTTFEKCQDQSQVRCETTEDSSIQFIGYLMPQHEQNDCTMLFTRHEATQLCREISIFKMFSRGVHLHNRSPIVLATPTLDADI